GDVTVNFRAAHQKLHTDPRTKGETANPNGRSAGGYALQPVKGCCRIGQFALALRKFTLGATHAAEVEPQCRKTAIRKGLEHGIGDFVVHRPATLWVRMKNECNRGAGNLAMFISAFKSAGRARNNNFWHVRFCLLVPTWVEYFLICCTTSIGD